MHCTLRAEQVHNGSPEEHLGLAMSPSTHTTVLLLLQLDSPVRRIVIFSRFLSAMDHPEILTAGSLPACLPWLTAWGDSVVDSPLPPLL